MMLPRKTNAKFPTTKQTKEDDQLKFVARVLNQDNNMQDMPGLNQNQPGINDTTTGNKIMQTIKDLAKDPRTYSTLANIGSIYAATQDDPTTASALSEVASRIDTGVQEKQAAEAAVEAERIKAEADAEKAEKDRAARIKAAELQGKEAALIKQKFEPAPGFIKANPSQTFLDDPKAQELGLTQTDIDTGIQYVNVKEVPKYLEDKNLAKSKLQANIEDTKIRNEQINKVITDPNLQNIIGTTKFGPFSVRKEFIASLGGTPEEVQTLLSIINTQDSNKILETLKKLKSQSRTGATGFGALNQQELGIISNAFLSLNKAQDFKTFVTNLKKVDETFSNATQREQEKYLKDYKSEDIELYQNPYKQVTTKKTTQKESISQPDITQIDTKELIRIGGI